MPLLKPFQEFSDTGLITLFARDPHAAQIVAMLAHYGFEATIPTVRRRLRKIFRQHHLLPTGRVPTPKDYERTRAVLITDTDGELLR